MMNEIEYLLVCLSEELAEVQQEISKCLRFTPDHTPECYPTTNLERARLELADVRAIAQMLLAHGVDVGILTPFTTAEKERTVDKIQRTKKLMAVSRELGTLEKSNASYY